MLSKSHRRVLPVVSPYPGSRARPSSTCTCLPMHMRMHTHTSLPRATFLFTFTSAMAISFLDSETITTTPCQMCHLQPRDLYQNCLQCLAPDNAALVYRASLPWGKFQGPSWALRLFLRDPRTTASSLPTCWGVPRDISSKVP